MHFNPDINKQSNEENRLILFNNHHVKQCSSYKYPGIVLDSNLDFKNHTENKITKCNKFIGTIKRLSVVLPRNALLQGLK